MEADQVQALNVNNLKSKLKELGLVVAGKKKDLQNRLLTHYGHDLGEDNSSVGNADHECMSEHAGSGVDTNEWHDAPSDRNGPPSSFQFRDIEDTIAPFSGEVSQNINSWIEEFESVCDIVKWNELQRFVYGRKIIVGAARLFAQGERGIRS